MKPISASLLIVATLFGCGGDDSSPGPVVQAISSKPEHVSGGNALIDIEVGNSAASLSVGLNGSPPCRCRANIWAAL